MKKSAGKLSWIVLALPLFLFWGVGATSEPDNWQVSAMQAILQQLKELRREVQSLRRDVTTLQQTVNKISQTDRSTQPSELPPPSTIDLADINSVAMGSPDASIAVLEFTDYQCPFCKKYHSETFSQLKERYIETGKVRYLTMDFPLNSHAQAEEAAVASKCADAQGVFWQMRDKVFAEQDRLDPSLYVELAREMQLDMPAFETCLKDSDHSLKVDLDVAYGQSVGVLGTPTFFIGKIQDGKLVSPIKLTGAQPFSAFSQAIDPILE